MQVSKFRTTFHREIEKAIVFVAMFVNDFRFNFKLIGLKTAINDFSHVTPFLN